MTEATGARCSRHSEAEPAPRPASLWALMSGDVLTDMFPELAALLVRILLWLVVPAS